MAPPPRAFDKLLPFKVVVDDSGVEHYAPRVRIAGATVVTTENEEKPELSETVITPADGGGGGGSGTPSDSDPSELGVYEGGPGSSVLYSRGDHQHAHGELPGGTTHAAADGSNPGFMTSAQFTKLAGIEPGATANVGTVTSVSGSGGISVATGTTTPAISIADGALAIAKLASIATARLLGRVSASTGAVETLTGAQATTLMDVVTSSLKGLMSAADKVILDAATAAATASAIVRRDVNGDFAGRYCTAEKFDTAAGRVQAVGSTLYAGYSDAGNVIVSGFSGLTLECRAGDTVLSAAAYGKCVAGGSWSIKCGTSFGAVEFLSSADVRRWAVLFPEDIQTTNATTTTAAVHAPTARGGLARRIIRARTSTASAAWVFEYDARLLSGAAAWTGGDPPVALFYGDGALLAAQCELDVSTTNVRSRVNGIAATTIDWSDTLEVAA